MLSKKCQYAIHAIHYLANMAPLQPVTIQSIADQKRIPKKFLEVILLKLRDAGIIISKRGKDGGYCIGKKPEEIFLADIIKLTDKPLALLSCLQEDPVTCVNCEDRHTCSIQRSLSSTQNDFMKLLKGKTLADIITERPLLEKLAEIS